MMGTLTCVLEFSADGAEPLRIPLEGAIALSVLQSALKQGSGAPPVVRMSAVDTRLDDPVDPGPVAYSLADAAARALKRIGKPLSTELLVREIETAGELRSDAKNPEGSLPSALYRRKKEFRYHNRKWSLVEWSGNSRPQSSGSPIGTPTYGPGLPALIREYLQSHMRVTTSEVVDWVLSKQSNANKASIRAALAETTRNGGSKRDGTGVYVSQIYAPENTQAGLPVGSPAHEPHSG